jgi:hypothetical protein
MDFDLLLRPETITALSVSLGAVIGGVVAVVAEFRRPEPKDAAHAADQAAKRVEAVGETKRLEHSLAIREECEHLNRSIWIVEKKLADRLTRIELQLSLLTGAPTPGAESRRRIASAPASSPPADETSQ